VTYADIMRLVIAVIATLGGLAAVAAWREGRTTQRMLRTLAAHQLKTPLSVTLSSLYTIYEYKDRLSDERVSELLETAIAEAHELDRLLSGFLTLTGSDSESARERGRFSRRLHALKPRPQSSNEEPTSVTSLRSKPVTKAPN
jgi:signal transduction histidine kinase